MMRSLKYVSLIFLLAITACGNPYSRLRTGGNTASALQFKPVFSKALYRCVVDGRVLFRKFHLSGLLLFKSFEDGSTRAVFQNELGISFFDFKWDAADNFEVVSIIPQLNKPALVKTLQKDMNLLLMKNLNAFSEKAFNLQDKTYYRFTLDKGVVYYISKERKLLAIENAGKNKVITINVGQKDTPSTMPDSVFFRHHKAGFTIDLKKLTPDAD